MKTRMFMALAGSSFLALASAASAQPTTGAAPAAGPAESATLGEVIVTARRRNEVLQDVPVSINAVTSATLDKLNIRRFDEIAAVIPGLSMSNNANGIGATASVRGVNYDVNASGNNGTVEFYFNDAPISAGNLFQAMFDVGQVELLRGPQGTLRGRASPSGSMTVTTHAPHLSEVGGYVSSTATDIGGFNAQGAVNLPIIKDMLAVRLAGVWDENDGTLVNSIRSSQEPHSATRGGRISVRFDPTADLTFGVTYQQLHQKIRSFDQVESRSIVDPTAAASPVFIEADDRLSVEDAPRRIRQRFDNLNLQSQWSFAGQRLNYVGEMNRQVFNSLQINDVGDFFPPNFQAFTKGYGQATHTYSKTWAHEIRLSSEQPVFGRFDYIVGAFYQQQTAPTNLFTPTVVLFGQPSAATFGTVVLTPIQRLGGSREESIFGNLTFHLDDATEISGGLRYIDFRSNGSLRVAGNVLAAANEDKHDNPIIYSVSAKHKFGDDLMVYASTGSSWRPPITVIGDFSLARSPLENSFLLLGPERSKSYEVGFKSTLMEKRLRVNVSAFHQDFKNYPYRSSSGVFFVETAANTTTTPPTLFQRVPAPFNFVAAVPVKVDGLEGEVSYQILDNWNISANGSYAKSKIKNGSVPCNDYFPRDGVPDTGSSIPTVAQIQAATGGGTISACDVAFSASLAPKWAGTVMSEYYRPLSGNMDGYVRGLLSLYGKSQNDPSNAVDDYKGYALLNIFLGVRDHGGAWEVSLYGKNITKTERVLSRSSTPLTTPFNILGASNTGVTTYSGGLAPAGLSMTAPREFGLNVRYAFGSR
ncbi:TonB-dependent receptor [Phenylobacterium sp. LjRoot225]|uniref:TonB-dependent receptor n=1 Tax=Phenylobacterium sp. LjRoot225 TaxID=3342285 RepID=UPI003ECFC6B5